jgi:hypothetical protein
VPAEKERKLSPKQKERLEKFNALCQELKENGYREINLIRSTRKACIRVR